MHRWRETGNRRFARQKLNQTVSDLLGSAERLLANSRKESGTEQNKGATEQKPPVAHLLGAGHGYRKNPCQETEDRLLEMAVNWHQSLRKGNVRDNEPPDQTRESSDVSRTNERAARVSGPLVTHYAGLPAPPRPTQT